MITTALIAAAGKGTRMLDLAKHIPKHLITIRKRPFLYYLLSHLSKAGIQNFVLVVGHKKENMESFARTYGNQFAITLVDQFERMGTDRYGTALPVLAAEPELQNTNFIAVYGDNLYSPRDIKKFTGEHAYTAMGVREVEHAERYGVVTIDDNDFVTDLIEKPDNPVSNLINAGIYTFTPDIFDTVRAIGISPRGEYELTDAIKAFTSKRRVKAIFLNDYWIDFGRPEDIKTVSDILDTL